MIFSRLNCIFCPQPLTIVSNSVFILLKCFKRILKIIWCMENVDITNKIHDTKVILMTCHKLCLSHQQFTSIIWHDKDPLSSSSSFFFYISTNLQCKSTGQDANFQPIAKQRGHDPIMQVFTSAFTILKTLPHFFAMS